MHEMSIAIALIDQIFEVGCDNNLIKVNEVEIEVGFLKQVVDEVMQEAYKSVTEGTIAEGSILRIKEISASVQCNQCKKIFKPELDNFLCPDCAKADVEVLKGNDIILKSVIGDKK